MADRKLDIFEALRAVDKRDGQWLERQPEDVQKEFSPPVFLRWVSAVNNPRLCADALELTNEFINVGMWNIASSHPELVFRLAAMCGSGMSQKHDWLGMPSGRRVNNKAKDFLARFYPSANDRELDLLLRLHTKETFSAFLDAAAPNEDTKEILAIYVKTYRREETKTSKSKSRNSSS